MPRSARASGCQDKPQPAALAAVRLTAPALLDFGSSYYGILTARRSEAGSHLHPGQGGGAGLRGFHRSGSPGARRPQSGGHTRELEAREARSAALVSPTTRRGTSSRLMEGRILSMSDATVRERAEGKPLRDPRVAARPLRQDAGEPRPAWSPVRRNARKCAARPGELLDLPHGSWNW